MFDARFFRLIVVGLAVACWRQDAPASAAEPSKWLQAMAFAVPKETTNQGSGYFSIVTGHNNRLYIGCAKYGVDSFLVEFDPKAGMMKVAVDTHQEIAAAGLGSATASGFAAQSKIHTRNNVGASGKIYFATKQGYPEKGEKRTDYLGGYPMVYDPKTGKTKVYPIPIAHQGIISITPDESRGVAYISTCSDNQPGIESSHFMILDLEKGTYRDLMDCQHMFAFIVVDYLGRAYHPIRGGDIARYDPRSGKLERLKQTIDGKPPTKESRLALPETHPINWDISPDGKTLYALAMSTNQLFAYYLTYTGDVLPGRSLGTLIPGAKSTDCRAMCVGPKGVVWAAITGDFDEVPGHVLHLASYTPGEKAARNHGAVAIRNPDYTQFKDASGKELPFHHGFHTLSGGHFTSKYVILGVTQDHDGSVYALALAPYTLLKVTADQLK